jgi:flagellar M-ring protein FliF
VSDINPVAIPTPAGLGPYGPQIFRGLASVQEFLKQPAIVRSTPIVLVGLVIMVGLAAIFTMREPAMTQLFPRLGEEDKSLVMQNLEAQGIKAKLDLSTGQLLVPRNDYYRAKMQLAAAGLPKASVTGYDLLTALPLGASRAVEQVKLKQAQESELARSIMEIRDIEGARVHLALPERSAFVRDQTPPSASVFLRLSPGRSLSVGQVQSITHLVSSSVPYMPVASVTVVDQSGGLLTNPSRDTELGLSSQQLDYKTQVEKLLRERVANLLTPIVGTGNFNSEVNADIDFTRTEQTNETFDPTTQIMRSQQETVQESSDGRARGVPGATANQAPNTPALTPNAPANNGANSTESSRNKSSTTVRNYEVSKEIRSTRRATGDIKRLTLAVVVRSGTSMDENGKAIEKPLSDEEKGRLTQLLQEAVGYSADRGDKLTIISSSFAEEKKYETRSWFDAPWLEDAIKQLAIVLILGVVVLGALKPFLERLLDRSLTAASRSDEPATAEDGTTIEVREGESLEQIKARLKPKKSTISPEMLDTANTYDDKVTLIRMLVGDDATRVTAVLKSLIQRDLN